MSNEMKEWLRDKEIEGYQRRAAKMIYEYMFKTFYGKDPIDKEFRIKNGSNGCCDKVLKYIDDTFINI